MMSCWDGFNAFEISCCFLILDNKRSLARYILSRHENKSVSTSRIPSNSLIIVGSATLSHFNTTYKPFSHKCIVFNWAVKPDDWNCQAKRFTHSSSMQCSRIQYKSSFDSRFTFARSFMILSSSSIFAISPLLKSNSFPPYSTMNWMSILDPTAILDSGYYSFFQSVV